MQFLTAMEECANLYVALMTSSHSRWNSYPSGIRNSIDAMAELRVVPIRPLMLAVLTRFAPVEAEKAFRLFVRWSVRFLIAGGNRSGSVEQAYAARAVSVAKGEITTAKQLITQMRSVVPTDSEFETAFSTARVSQQYLARYYLRALELQKKGQPDPEWIPNDNLVINLEHVLPETPGNNWPNIEPEMAEANFRRIGNLVLLQAKQNTLIGNSSFSDKRKALRDSAYLLTQEVGRKADWNIEEINERQKSLSKLAVETWPLDLS
jgi:hypothetical protein